MAEAIKFGLSAPMPGADTRGLLEFSKKADKLGFSAIWYPDHTVFVAPGALAPEAWTIASAAAGITSGIHLATVSDPHKIHPATFAQRLATVDQLSGGRATVAMGVGESMNLDAYGIPWNKPFTRMREAVEVMQLLWKNDESNPVHYEGEFFNLKDAFLQIRPFERDRIPVYFATHTPRGLALTGEMGDGWLPIDLNPALYERYLGEIHAAADKAGRDRGEIDPALWVFTSLGENEDEAYKTIEPFKYVLIMQEQLAAAGYDVKIPDEYKGLNYFNIIPQDTEGRAKFREIGRFFPREAIMDFTITGSKDDCIKRIEAFVDKGVRNFVLFYRFSPDPEKALETYAKEIIPYFKG